MGDYLDTQVRVWREVRRVLRDDGVAWLNIGDTYLSDPGNGRGGGSTLAGGTPHLSGGPRAGAIGKASSDTGPRRGYGQMALVPQRLAIMLQDDGWTMRSVVIWAKPAPMPESVSGWSWQQCRVKVRGNLRGVGTGKMDSPEAIRLAQGFNVRWDAAHDDRPNSDREGKDFVPSAVYEDCPGCQDCEPNGGLVLRKGSWRATRSHEYLLMLTKGMQYWSNQEAVKEQAVTEGDDRAARVRNDNKSIPTDKIAGIRGGSRPTCGRNPRDVQSWPPEPLGALAPYGPPVDVRHFAAFPTSLPSWAIRATCPERVCAMCHEPWAPVVERHIKVMSGPRENGNGKGLDVSDNRGSYPRATTDNRILGLRRTCEHVEADYEPGTILDPYAGIGTTLLAALRLGRRAIGIELNGDYVRLAHARIKADAPLLVQEESLAETLTQGGGRA